MKVGIKTLNKAISLVEDKLIQSAVIAQTKVLKSKGTTIDSAALPGII